MITFPRLRAKDYQFINDGLHQALDNLDDFRWGGWWLRCVEFHFGKGNYRIGDQFGWHVHKEVQLEIPVRGDFRFSIKPSKQIRLQPGDVLVVPPGITHRWKSEAPGIMIGLSLAVVPRASSLDTPISNSLKPTTFAPPGIELILDGLMGEFLITPQTDEFSVKSRASWMYLVITRVLGALPVPESGISATEVASEPSFRRERVVSKIIRYIDANIDGDLTMERIEAVVGLSARQIHRLFIEVTGGSCHGYIMDRRLEIARSKLQADPTLSIKEIAYACGFASPAHFSAKFKKHFGVPPTEYR